MRIVRARLLLPPHMRATAAGDAHRIAAAVADALASSASPPARLTVEVQGGGRPASHLSHTVRVATARALKPLRGS